MFITDQLTPIEMLSELLTLSDCSAIDTRRFRNLGHDKNLCPAFQSRIETMLRAYKAHRTDVHDIQGPRDEGVDVDLRYDLEGPHRAGLQIKSFKEIDDWKEGRDPSFMKSLKAQVLAAVHHLGCEDYFILVCTDEIHHKKQIRMICSELKQVAPVRIVLPHHALSLYERNDEQISVLVTQLLCKHDAVLEAAINEAAVMAPDLAFVQLALLCRACEGQVTISQEELGEVYEDWLDSSSSAATPNGIGDLLMDLDGNGFCLSTDGIDQLAIGDFSTSWLALYFDQKQRNPGLDVRRRLSLLLEITPTAY
jgi:hypothetical protein